MKIEGKIIDSKGEPLAMANITIQDGSRAKKLGVSSDLDGNFTLENDVIEPDSVFMISYIGFEPKLLKASELDGKKNHKHNPTTKLTNNTIPMITPGCIYIIFIFLFKNLKTNKLCFSQ